MPNQTLPSDSDAILFPAFLYGNLATCRRKMKAEAKKWAKRYQERGGFPEPKMAPVPAASVIFCRETAVDMLEFGFTPAEPGWYNLSREVNQGPKPSRWQLHLLHMPFRIDTSLNLKHAGEARRIFGIAYESFVCRYPWGALSAAISHAMLNTIDVVSRRLEALFSFWDKLDTLQYIEFGNQPVPLAQVIRAHFEGTIAMWVDHPSGDVRQDLRAAIDQMRRASEDEIRARLIKRLREVAEVEPDLQHREWLKTPGIIEAELSHYHTDWPDSYGELTTGRNGALGGLLAQYERRIFPPY